MARAVVARDRRAQLGQAERDGVAQRIALERARKGRACGGRSGRAGLADLHVDDAPARGLGGARGLHDIHHDEGIDIAPS